MSKIQTALEQELLRLQQRLERERKARIEAESIAEQGLRALYIKQKETALMQQIATAANEAATPTKALQTVLDIVCDYTGWAVGHIYMTSDLVGSELRPTDLWYISSANHVPFRRTTERTVFQPGTGLPGRVLASGQPQWIIDVTTDPGFLRASIAAKVGLHSAFAFPIKIGEKTVAVFEFFTEEPMEPDQRHVEIMNFANLQLGRVIERTRAENELRQYAARLQLTNRELQEIANVAAHDLQEPLRKIQAFGDMLKLKVADALPDEGRDYLDRMQNAARRMQQLINDMLTFSRITLKAQPFVSVDLTVVAREVVTEMSLRLQQAGAVVTIHNLPTIEADPLQMRQLISHLLSNSLKFSKRDAAPHIAISASYAETNGSSTANNQHKDCCLIIEDNGIGFDERYAERIFGIFQRAHTNEPYEGTGMGLAICRKIAERHNGSIVAQSSPESGSRFIVTLPLRHGEEHPLYG